MKPFEFGKWHAWEGTSGILLSDEDTKTLRAFKNTDECINWLFVENEQVAARALYEHVKGEK